MKMKKAVMVVFILLLNAAAFYSCKKGPDDPFISFRSRKSRLTGTYINFCKIVNIPVCGS